MLRLVAYAHDGVRRFPLRRGEIVIGSDPDCDVCLSYTGVAHRHARLDWSGDALRIEDLGSRKGLLVNGLKVRRADLEVLDEVRLGGITLLVEDVAPPPEAVAATDEEPPAPRVSPELLLERLAAVSDWVLGDAESRSTVEALLGRLLADFGGGVLFLLQGDEPDIGIKLVVATDSDWLARGQELRDQVTARRATPAARHEAGAFDGHLAEAPAWLFYRYFRALERSNLLIGAFPRYAPDAWSALPALRTLSDLLLLGLVHHVGRYEPLLPGHGGRNELRLAPGLMTGESPAMRRLIEQLGAAVDPPVTVLLRGEPHTGRELLARSLHLSGPHADAPFVVATCSGASPAQIEADLFGAEVPGRGGPLERQGKLALADGGTLYLDGVDELPLELQARLVRFLRSGEVEPAGGQRARRVAVRLIAASHGPLEPRVAEDLFRVDLAHRLSRLAFDVPPLRERREDLPLLIQSYVNLFCHESGKRVQGITVDAMAALVRYDYPGNLQELENLIRRLVYVCPAGAPIRHNLLPENLRIAGVEAQARAAVGTELRLDGLIAACERAAIREALRRSRGNKAQAAKLLGLSRNGLAMKMARLGLERGGAEARAS